MNYEALSLAQKIEMLEMLLLQLFGSEAPSGNNQKKMFKDSHPLNKIKTPFERPHFRNLSHKKVQLLQKILTNTTKNESTTSHKKDADRGEKASNHQKAVKVEKPSKDILKQNNFFEESEKGIEKKPLSENKSKKDLHQNQLLSSKHSEPKVFKTPVNIGGLKQEALPNNENLKDPSVVLKQLTEIKNAIRVLKEQVKQPDVVEKMHLQNPSQPTQNEQNLSMQKNLSEVTRFLKAADIKPTLNPSAQVEAKPILTKETIPIAMIAPYIPHKKSEDLKRKRKDDRPGLPNQDEELEYEETDSLLSDE